ncbi:MAG: type II and III secretion system protein [Betaproteobacteria bacterium]|nr:type II and III secretion system protein [Betaproteobacteria bacterium]MDH5220128.1 type II and III secretion system protein [Betaproteobacteria bacterium]MDH5352313.1 type II and III secretion system protein [Betaproteobacteria bacterium]
MHWKLTLSVAVLAGALAGCAQEPAKPSTTHLGIELPPPPAAGNIPPPVQVAPVLPKPEPKPAPETYSVVVNGVPAQELLFALARDARINIDVHPGITGSVTLNAVDQTLPQLLERIGRQVDMRYELSGQNLQVLPDTPYLRAYRVDFVTASRNLKMQSQTNTQFGGGSASGSGTGGSAGGGGGGGATTGTGSTASVDVTANSQLWDTLVQNIQDILGGGPTAKPAAGAATAPGGQTASNVIGNRESGVLLVRASSRQHAKVQEFLDSVMANVRRQVLIEATVAEVQLSNEYQRGIDWQRLRTGAAQTGRPGFNTGQSGVEFNQISAGTPAQIATNAFLLGGAVVSQNLNVAIKLLESFGNVRVLSSPKISVVNNQIALLRVTRDIVYFTITPSTTPVTVTGGVGGIVVPPAFTTTPNVAAEGFMMSVLPQISEAETVVLNVRPTIRRKVADAIDPNPALSAASPNLIPVFETREFDSMLRIQSGQTAVLGGLMQDSIENVEDTIPGVNKIPFFGKLFAQERKITRKTELVIFLRVTVINDASVDGDYAHFRNLLPTENFLTRPRGNADAAGAPADK